MKEIKEVIPEFTADLIQKQAAEIEELQRELAQATMRIEELTSELEEKYGEMESPR